MQHLIHIGFAKAGTSYFKRWCMLHPDISFVHGGIGGLHNSLDMLAVWNTPARLAVTSNESLAGGFLVQDFLQGADRQNDISLIWQERRRKMAQILHGLFPAARILILTRAWNDLVAPAYSQFLKSDGQWGIAPRTFDDFVTSVAADPEAFTSCWDYADTIQTYREVFGHDRVLILPYEFLAEDATAFTAEIAAWTGVPNPVLGVGRPNRAYSASGCARVARLQHTLLKLTSAGPPGSVSVVRKLRLWLETHGERIGLGLFDGPALKSSKGLKFEDASTRAFHRQIRDDRMFAPYLGAYFPDRAGPGDQKTTSSRH